MVAPRRDSASPPLAAPRGFPKGVSRRDPRPWRRQRGRDWGPEMGGPGRGHTDGAGRSGPIPGLTFGDGKIARRGGEAVTVEVQGVESERSLRGRLPRAPRGRDLSHHSLARRAGAAERGSLPASGSAGFSPGDGAEARQCLGHVTTCPPAFVAPLSHGQAGGSQGRGRGGGLHPTLHDVHRRGLGRGLARLPATAVAGQS